MNYGRRRQQLIDRQERCREIRVSKEQLEACKNEIIDSRGGTFGFIEPTQLEYRYVKCKLNFTKRPTKQTFTPTGKSKLEAIEAVEP